VLNGSFFVFKRSYSVFGLFDYLKIESVCAYLARHIKLALCNICKTF
jgi:hypothetical protein